MSCFYNFQKEGFFVECGAFDGEKESNSLFFERDLAWNGLLIEADPHHYKTLKGKHRKAFTSNTCLSTVSYPVLVSYIYITYGCFQKKKMHPKCDIGGQISKLLYHYLFTSF